MNRQDNTKTYKKLQRAYPSLSYESFDIQTIQGKLRFTYRFSLNKEIFFTPSLEFPDRSFYKTKSLDSAVLENIAFHIGMVELISYWKATCSPLIVIKPFHLDPEQINWWKKLFFNGLGEFFYLNGLDLDSHNFVEFETGVKVLPEKVQLPSTESYIVPIGGGKDSVVSLELLKDSAIIPLIVNPREASLGTTRIAGFERNEIIEVTRKIDPKLLELNSMGFLNGHTPFSALLAFISLTGAILCGSRNIALSNESSANEATIPGTKINHQYSKSFEFEKDFRWYVSQYISDDLNYFSLLRPLNEIQIASIFSKHPEYFKTFKSCNAGSKTDSWCQKCPKCLFTYIILSPFIDEDTLANIFGANLLHDKELLTTFYQLTGISDIKPFDCIGTIDEVNTSVQSLLSEYATKNIPILLDSYKQLRESEKTTYDLSNSLKIFDSRNNLTTGEFLLIQESLKNKQFD